MRILMIALFLAAGSLLVMPVKVLAHGKEEHKVVMDEQMKKLHAIMPMFSLASAQMETALEKGDLAIVESEAEKITAAVPELKKSKPHKNIKQWSKFVYHASNLEKAVITTVDLAKKRDSVEAKAAYKKIEETCAACHAKFRD
jgi:cytochrome c556